jgi:hypothetical protein
MRVQVLTVAGVAAGLAIALVPACSRQKTQSDEEISKVAQSEKTLETSEEDLLSQRGALQRERKKLTEERSAILEKRKTAAASERPQLDQQEASLMSKERDLVDKEGELNRRVEELLRQRADMVQRVTTAAGSVGSDPGAQVTRREQGVALREKDFAHREAELARREAELAAREREQARREREGCPAVQPATVLRMEPPKGLRYSRHDVEPVYRKALKTMQERGILQSDLPAGTVRLVDEARGAMEAGDFVKAKYAADQLLEIVGELHVDRSFIGGKMTRLASAMKGRSLAGDRRKEVDALFQEATAAYGDGKFTQANSRINRILALLR